MPLELAPEETRVLGALIEKDLTTPEYYPLSLNALVNACNQKSNREPVVGYTEDAVRAALESLRERGYIAYVHESGSRVEKYRHKLGEVFNFTRGELALTAVLLLRGPQTTAELRERTQRMHAFEDLETAAHFIEKLVERDLAVLLPRQPGHKEPRWIHLYGGAPDTFAEPAQPSSPRPDRLAALEDEVAALRRDVEELKRQLEPLKTLLS